mgnify:CR=1 FL=1
MTRADAGSHSAKIIETRSQARSDNDDFGRSVSAAVRALDSSRPERLLPNWRDLTGVTLSSLRLLTFVATESKPSGLEEIGVSEGLRTKRLKFGMPERSDRREEREFAEFQWRPKGLSRFVHSLDLFVHFGSSQNGRFSQVESITFRSSNRPREFRRQETNCPEFNFTLLGEDSKLRDEARILRLILQACCGQSHNPTPGWLSARLDQIF